MKLSTILVSAVAITSSIVPCTGVENKIRGDGPPDDNLPPPFTREFDCDSENRIEVLKKSKLILEITTSYLFLIPTAEVRVDGQRSMWFLSELHKLPAFAESNDLGKLIAAQADDDGLVTKIGVVAAIAEYLKDECAHAIIEFYGSVGTTGAGVGFAYGGSYGGGYGEYNSLRRLIV